MCVHKGNNLFGDGSRIFSLVYLAREIFGQTLGAP